ncbi:hypothetical protein M758_6G043600 [Ceratodon purpureus]|uniref:Secreted protein n=1 Tax=Ceratodon purpureus TaxID=3225 RepID=A0A8T0HAD7_CERPU|nr:hypothetical protein KC19_6G043100 [Ceratodon purpureus]KAG0612652.1 hypothetical protein M758_6G043600 [Ceratodon purpureus]
MLGCEVTLLCLLFEICCESILFVGWFAESCQEVKATAGFELLPYSHGFVSRTWNREAMWQQKSSTH